MHQELKNTIIKPIFVKVGERRTPRARCVRRPTRTRIMRARALLTHLLAVLSSSPRNPLLLWWALMYAMRLQLHKFTAFSGG